MEVTVDATRDPSTRDGAEVARHLAVDPATGLASAEAERRLQRDGPNELRAKAPVPMWRKVVRQFQDPLIYLLLVAVAISTAAWLAEGATGAPIDALVISAIVALNGALGFIQESRAEAAVKALQSMTAATSTVLREGQLRTVPSRELVCGDILVLNEGDAVGADARLLTAAALRLSEASLTGESEPVTKTAATLPDHLPLGDRKDMVFRGTSVVQGVGRAVVTATGMDTEVGSIAEMLEATREDPSPLQKEIASVSRLLGLTVIVIAVVVMIVTALVNEISTFGHLVTVLLLGVSLAVAAVPEGLPAILSVVLAIGVQQLARRNAVVKKLHSVETLGSATVIASDKTGTLTKNEMTIQCIRTASGEVELTGAGYRPEGTALAGGRELSDPALTREAGMVLAGGCLANNAQLTSRDGEWQIQGDPTEAAFLVAAHKLAGTVDRARQFERRGEIPFTSERKMMSTLVSGGDAGTAVVVKGAPDVLLSRCVAVQVGDEVVPLDPVRRAAASADVEELSAQAFRTLGVAYRWVDDPDTCGPLDVADEQNLVYVGVAGIIDPPRPEVAQAVAEARRAGVRVMMITGDHPTTAARIAEDLGIVGRGAPAVTGAELDTLSPGQLQDVTATTSVYARVAPRNKLQIVDALQARGEVVAMTGDGVNDAPALKSADIGVAMGITGTQVTKEAAKMILADDNFATIVAAVRQGRAIFDNIKKFLRYLLSSNMGEVFTVFFGVVFAGFIGITTTSGEAIVVPLLATQILWINLVTDSGPALAMGVDPEIDDVMSRPPRRPTDRLIDREMWRGIVFIGLVMGFATLLTMDIFLPGGLVEGSDSLDVARTAGFTTLVFAQFFNVFNSRSETTSAFRHLFSNGWLWASVGLGVALQIAVVQLPLLQTAFGTVSMDLAHWAVALAMASTVLWFDELRKLALRALRRSGTPATERTSRS
ncbi:ATPase, P-type (transporting), HAD superfamily, subfamily IC [Mycolicibacterium vanbaalenii PYR-1]|uniref:ATPase, P-type (Transporting), HAD superfamily, subfamily IC n=1 Tax=Mycolicibacterium vanbaalenii (strain DSM 7251 / JCM 13017 / BCRC 16820 / KCTC 9966 / NRRL B-24157 / PYR-1) TaxID=350058 RepID=A1THH8_MYCVP|nr:cation-translocating P-type ATPase [Mycolicibacterium vanbaalenii]ABM16628.1 ATPase, P-type (transporting), HAD superfamily, subfamily IC [Mycolicibacterium vanbaalenii PYR-1]